LRRALSGTPFLSDHLLPDSAEQLSFSEALL
jgi:hypothetical protein